LLAAVRVAPAEPPVFEAAVLLDWLDVDELDEEPPQPAMMRARAMSESTAAGKRGKDMDQLLVLMAITAGCD
jgi:hypothetical protein